MLPTKQTNEATEAGLNATFRVQFLGAGDTFCNGGRANQCILGHTDDSMFMIDCGPTTANQAQRLGVDLSPLDAVFFTHIHGDHTLGFPLLVLHLQFVLGRTRDLTVFTPPGAEDLPKTLLGLVFPDVVKRGIPFELQTRSLAAGESAVVNGVTVEGFEMKHSVPVVGYRFSKDGKTFAVSGDTTPCDGLVEMSQGADLLVTECSYPVAIPEVPHTSLEELLALEPRLGAKRIAVVHTNNTFDPSPFFAPEDGETIEV